MHKKLFTLIALIITCLIAQSKAASFGCAPSPAYRDAGGMGLYAQNSAGTYNLSYSIYDGVGNPVVSADIDSFIMPDNQLRIFAVWNLRNSNNMLVAPGVYRIYCYMKNVVNGQNYEYHQDVGVQSGMGWGGLNVTMFHSSSNDEIYRQSAVNSQGKAIIFFEGFDPLNIATRLGIILSSKIRTTPIVQNYDVYSINFQNGGASISTNGDRGLSIINQIQSNYGPYNEIVVIGKSMGGVIARYSLAKAEQLGMNIPVKKFISIDAPQKGAQINLTYQASALKLSQSGGQLLFINLFGGNTLVPNAIQMLDSDAAKNMLYWHVRLVESQIKSNIDNECPFNENNLVQIRKDASVWHDQFYSELSKLGKGPGGYPSYCKNYAIAFTPAKLLYNNKTANQKIATWKPSTKRYHFYSDPKDINTGSYLSHPIGSDYTIENGYVGDHIFMPIESVLDIASMGPLDFYSSMPSMAELSRLSYFDKIYVKSNVVPHLNVPDEEVIQFINEILTDSSPKRSSWPVPTVTPLLQNILLD